MQFTRHLQITEGKLSVSGVVSFSFFSLIFFTVYQKKMRPFTLYIMLCYLCFQLHAENFCLFRVFTKWCSSFPMNKFYSCLWALLYHATFCKIFFLSFNTKALSFYIGILQVFQSSFCTLKFTSSMRTCKDHFKRATQLYEYAWETWKMLIKTKSSSEFNHFVGYLFYFILFLFFSVASQWRGQLRDLWSYEIISH